MYEYFVNQNVQSNGDHEVHKKGCIYMPLSENRISLGYFFSCKEAVKKAKEYYLSSNGCYFCSPDCHTS